MSFSSLLNTVIHGMFIQSIPLDLVTQSLSGRQVTKKDLQKLQNDKCMSRIFFVGV